MSYKLKVNNKELKIRDGFTIKDELNETLDSGTIQFLSENGIADVESFDSVVIESDNSNFKRKKQLLDTYDTEIQCFKESLETSDYFYTSSIFSETKMLERITLPNLKITRNDEQGEYFFSVFAKVYQYCKRYLPYKKYFKQSGSGYEYKPIYKYDKALETRLSMECPEFTWNTPTLKEVLTDLFAVADLIPVVKDNVLTFFDLNKKGNPIDTTKLSNNKVSGSSADYCDSLTLPMKNIIGNKPIIKHERVMVRSNSGEVNTNNAIFKVQKPIYSIRKCYLYGYMDRADQYAQYSDAKLYKIDITDHIVEKQYFDALSSSINTTLSSAPTNKAFNLYYTRGAKEIIGLGEIIKVRMQGYSQLNLTRYAYMSSLYLHPDSSMSFGTDAVHFNNKGFMRSFIEIEYETIDEETIKVHKQTKVRNGDNSLFDSQNSNSVNLKAQNIFEYAKVNRLSSKIVDIYGEYTNENDIPNLSDYIGEKILFSREITYYDHIFFFKGSLCDNYILKDYFTGIQSKKRVWSIVDEGESVLRHDVYDLFITFDTVKKVDAVPYFINFSNIDVMMFANIYSNYENNANLLNTVLMQTYTGEFNTPNNSDNSYYAIVENNTSEVNSCFSVYFSMENNYTYGDAIEVEESALYLQKPVPYANKEGLFEQMTIVLTDYISENPNEDADGIIEYLQTYHQDNDNVYENDLLNYLRELPVIKKVDRPHELKMTTKFIKDSGERVGATIQFNYVSGDEKIIVGKNFTKALPIGEHSIQASDIEIYFARDHHYKIGENEPVGELTTIRNLTILNENGSASYRVPVAIGENDSWCIYDKKNKEILLAVNGIEKIYLNFMYSRDNKIYNNQLDRVDIGDIKTSLIVLVINNRNNPAEVQNIELYDRTILNADIRDF